MTDETPILSAVVDGVATITLNRPTVLNALNIRLDAAVATAPSNTNLAFGPGHFLFPTDSNNLPTNTQGTAIGR